MNKTEKILIIAVLILAAGIVFVNLTRGPASDGSDCNKEYYLYTANLDGSNMKQLIMSPYQQMSHARVSLDKEWVTFTRFNNIGKDGCMSEAANNYNFAGEQYIGTEIMLMRIDGSGLRTLVPYGKYTAAANSYWTPDGKGLVYIYNDGEKSGLNHIIFDDSMETESEIEIPTPDYIQAGDPYWGKDSYGKDWIVFPCR